MSRSRAPSISVAINTLTLIAGLLIRFAPLGLVYLLAKYSGSMLWALLAYWILSTLFADRGTVSVAMLTALMTASIECVKLIHVLELHRVRVTLPGILLLGRVFSGWDIVACWRAIAAGAWIDKKIRRRLA